MATSPVQGRKRGLAAERGGEVATRHPFAAAAGGSLESVHKPGGFTRVTAEPNPNYLSRSLVTPR
jgi:hypothetical protein